MKDFVKFSWCVSLIAVLGCGSEDSVNDQTNLDAATACTRPNLTSFSGRVAKAPDGQKALVVNNQLLKIDDPSVLQTYNRGDLNLNQCQFGKVPSLGQIVRGQSVVALAGYPAGFKVNSLFFPTDCNEAITRNNSTVTMISAAEYSALGNSGDLICINR